jgi:hypothetical protein
MTLRKTPAVRGGGIIAFRKRTAFPLAAAGWNGYNIEGRLKKSDFRRLGVRRGERTE